MATASLDVLSSTTARQIVSCAHCALPVPKGRVPEQGEQAFCCAGCETVYGALHELGLETFYQVAADLARQPARTTDRAYQEFDTEAFQQQYCKAAAQGLQQIELYLEGVHCAACVWLVEKLPKICDGVIGSHLDMGRSMARIVWDPRRVKLSTVAQNVDRLGYPVHPFRGTDRRALRRKEDRRALVRLGVVGACAGNVMLLALALYAGLFDHMDPAFDALFRWLSLALTLPVVGYGAAPFFRGAMVALRMKSPNMDLPIALGVAVSFAWGLTNMVRGSGEIYFDSLCVLVFLLLVGRYLQRKQQQSASDATEIMHALTPLTARVRVAGDVTTVPIESIAVATEVVVRSGESIPVDGLIVEGATSIDASLLTGESRPQQRTIGSPVFAGTVNVSSEVVIETTATGVNTRLGALMQQVEQFSARRAHVVRLADRIAGVFVVVVLLLAAGTLAWVGATDLGEGVQRALALLIITCPCALGLATPLVFSVAIGRSAKRGIVIKGGDALECLSRPGELLLDKTGTLTKGRHELVAWVGTRELFAQVAAIETTSAHHLAQAFVRAAEADFDPSELPVAEDVSETVGLGIVGRVAGKQITVGSQAFVADACGEIPQALAAQAMTWAGQAITPVFVAVDGQCEGVAGLADPLRDDAERTLRALSQAGWRLSILSGDDAAVVTAIADKLAVRFESVAGGLSPEQKLAEVERRKRATDRPIVMVGDGVNDAAALAVADCGIGVRGGAEASLAAADIYIADGSLDQLRQVICCAERSISRIKQNSAFSLLYNAAGATMAMLGWVTPLIAAVLMPLSSLTVIVHAFRGRSYDRKG